MPAETPFSSVQDKPAVLTVWRNCWLDRGWEAGRYFADYEFLHDVGGGGGGDADAGVYERQACTVAIVGG